MKGWIPVVAAICGVAAIAGLARIGASRIDQLLESRAELRSDFPVIVDIPKGTTATAVARQLEEERIVEDARFLRLWLQASGLSQRLQAGEYAIEKPMSVVEVGELLVSGRVVLHPVTVPEGLSLDETAERMSRSGLWTRESLERAFLDPAPVRTLDPAATDLEGYLFPDTYHFARGETPEAVAAAMVGRFREAWTRAGGEMFANGRTVREVATLASLIEKETSLPDEHGLVASVYWNRLRRGMRLECDPTVITAMKKAGLWTGGPLLIRDLSLASPWNTYVNAGLPPGPIASFGLPSLKAALQPAESDYLFFVATGTGGHRFAATHREHERNVAMYRQVQRERRGQISSPGRP